MDANLTIRKMYELYTPAHENPVSEMIYQRIFGTEYNFSFFVPKKDQCLTCNIYNRASQEEKISLQAEYDKHIQRKNDAFNSSA